MELKDTVIVVLAAGISSRMGHPKQLLEIKGKALIERAVETALEVDCPVLVVLGANHGLIEEKLLNYELEIVNNKHWQEGMGASIRAAMNKIQQLHTNNSGVLFTLADQPDITKEHLVNLLQEGATFNQIVATKYGGVTGVPAYFPKEVYHDLVNLKGDQGAKYLLQTRSKQVKTIRFEAAAIDIDTEQDWNKYNSDEGNDI